jgi:hypothetical protein
VTADGTTIDRASDRERIQVWVLLRARTWDGDPLYFVLRTYRYGSNWDEGAFEYFYNEHTCPTNYLGVEAVIAHGDDDPHGALEFVAAVDVPAVDSDESDEDMSFDEWREVFPQIAGSDMA